MARVHLWRVNPRGQGFCRHARGPRRPSLPRWPGWTRPRAPASPPPRHFPPRMWLSTRSHDVSGFPTPAAHTWGTSVRCTGRRAQCWCGPPGAAGGGRGRGPASTRWAWRRGGDPARAPGRHPGSLPRPALWGRRLTEHNSRLALEKPCGPAPGCRRPQPHVSREPASVPLRAGSLGPRRPALPSGTSAPGARGQAPTGAWASSQPDAVPTRRLGLQVCLSVAVFGGTCPSRGSARPRRVFVLSLSFLPPT